MVAYIVSPKGRCPSWKLVNSVALSVSMRLANEDAISVEVKFAPHSPRSFARMLGRKDEAVLVAGSLSPLKTKSFNLLPISNGELDKVVDMLKESRRKEDSFSIIAPYLENRVRQ